MKITNFDPFLFELEPKEKIGHSCKITRCKMKPKYLDKSKDNSGYYCINHYPIRINMTKIDVIRNGRFSNPKAEEIRKDIISLDCGLNKGMIEALNNEIYNERDENKLIESLSNTRDAMLSEIP